MAFDAIGKSMADFASGAASGAFAVSEASGTTIRDAILEMAHWVDHNLGDLNRLTQQQPLGDSQGADAMKPYVAQVAADDQGFLPMLMKFRESLTSAEKGITAAMANYKAMDERGVGRQQAH